MDGSLFLAEFTLDIRGSPERSGCSRFASSEITGDRLRDGKKDISISEQ